MSLARQQLLEPQRMAAILVIGVVAAELVVAGLAVALDGAVIFLMDLEAQKVASVRPCMAPKSRRIVG